MAWAQVGLVPPTPVCPPRTTGWPRPSADGAVAKGSMATVTVRSILSAPTSRGFHIYVYIHAHTRMYTHAHTCITHEPTRMYTVYVYTQAHICIHTYIRAHIYVYTRTHIYIYTHTCVYTRAHTHIHIFLSPFAAGQGSMVKKAHLGPLFLLGAYSGLCGDCGQGEEAEPGAEANPSSLPWPWSQPLLCQHCCRMLHGLPEASRPLLSSSPGPGPWRSGHAVCVR